MYCGMKISRTLRKASTLEVVVFCEDWVSVELDSECWCNRGEFVFGKQGGSRFLFARRKFLDLMVGKAVELEVCTKVTNEEVVFLEAELVSEILR